MLKKLIAPLMMVFLFCGQAQAVTVLQVYKLNTQEVTLEKPLQTAYQCDHIKGLIIKFQRNIGVESNFRVSCNLLRV